MRNLDTRCQMPHSRCLCNAGHCVIVICEHKSKINYKTQTKRRRWRIMVWWLEGARSLPKFPECRDLKESRKFEVSHTSHLLSSVVFSELINIILATAARFAGTPSRPVTAWWSRPRTSQPDLQPQTWSPLAAARSLPRMQRTFSYHRMQDVLLT